MENCRDDTTEDGPVKIKLPRRKLRDIKKFDPFPKSYPQMVYREYTEPHDSPTT